MSVAGMPGEAPMPEPRRVTISRPIKFRTYLDFLVGPECRERLVKFSMQIS